MRPPPGTDIRCLDRQDADSIGVLARQLEPATRPGPTGAGQQHVTVPRPVGPSLRTGSAKHQEGTRPSPPTVDVDTAGLQRRQLVPCAAQMAPKYSATGRESVQVSQLMHASATMTLMIAARMLAMRLRLRSRTATT